MFTGKPHTQQVPHQSEMLQYKIYLIGNMKICTSSRWFFFLKRDIQFQLFPSQRGRKSLFNNQTRRELEKKTPKTRNTKYFQKNTNSGIFVMHFEIQRTQHKILKNHLQKELQDLQFNLHWKDKPIPGM